MAVHNTINILSFLFLYFLRIKVILNYNHITLHLNKLSIKMNKNKTTLIPQ